MRAVAFTVDVDRDVNLACRGQVPSTSQGGSGARFDSSARGLELVLGLMRETGVKGTFFWEGRTAEELPRGMDLARMMRGHEVALHGYDHEDFPGKETGIPLDREQVKGVLDRAEAALDLVFGKAPRGFRAPYQRTSQPLLEELAVRGYLYDSSETARLEQGRISPYRNEHGLLEVPVCWSLDRKGGRIVSYLWPYHEGKRPMSDYLDLVARLEDGLLVMATHSWHLVENFCEGILPRRDVERGMDDLRAFFETVSDSGAEFVTIADHLRRTGAL